MKLALALLLANVVAALPVKLRLDTSEAEQVLAILQKEKTTAADWQKLFATEPYVRLKKREAAMGRAFTDDEFRKFVLSPELRAQREALGRTLEAWTRADLHATGKRILDYLPKDAVIAAKVFPMIKPRTNSFVFDVDTDPAIFLYLDPKTTQAQFENTVAHELHHIGFASVKSEMGFMGSFGEGFAMLAAAGSPDTHPHANSPIEERQRWDRDVANFDADAAKLEAFFLDILDGRLTDERKIRETAFSFFGVQGPWYTVGWTMAATIEKRFGREVLIECMTDPVRLLQKFNEATNRRKWSENLIRKLRTPDLSSRS